jgi:hypothetical protein
MANVFIQDFDLTGMKNLGFILNSGDLGKSLQLMASKRCGGSSTN